MSDINQTVVMYTAKVAIPAYSLVYLDTDALANPVTVATQKAIGICNDADGVAIGGDCSVVIQGKTKAIAGTVLAADVTDLMWSAGPPTGVEAYAFGAAATPNVVIGRRIVKSGHPEAAKGEQIDIFVSPLYFPTA